MDSRNRFGRCLLPVGLLLAMVSCQSPQVEPQYQEIQRMLDRIQSRVKYDPYTAKVYYDAAAIAQDWKFTSDLLISRDCRMIPLRPVNDFERAKHHVAAGMHFDNEEWLKDLFQQVQSLRGWAISQVEYPKAGLHHGDYEVPCVIELYVTWCGYQNYPLLKRQFTIKGTRPDAAAAVAAAPTAVAPVPAAAAAAAAPAPTDLAQKLKQLKTLLDSGLITPAEFEQKRKALLDQL